MSATSLFLASIISLAAAGPAAFQTFVVQESLTSAPQGFTKVGLAADSTPINSGSPLPPPTSLGWRRLSSTKAEVNAFLAPTAEAVTAVQTWLASHDLVANVSSSAGDWLSLTVPVSKANEMLAAKYETFQHIASGTTYARTLSFSLPSRLQTTSLPSTRPLPSTTLSPFRRFFLPPNPLLGYHQTPLRPRAPPPSLPVSCLQSLYKIPTTAATEPISKNSIAVAGFIDQFARRADLKTFLQSFRSSVDDTTTFTTQELDGGKNSQGASQAGIEANLDIQYTIGVATGVPVYFVSVGDSFQDGDLEGFLDIVNFLSDEDDVPPVMTTSYGENETDMSKALAFKLCEAYMAFGARGTSVLFASGDGGVEGGQAQTCTKYQAAFPAGCPYLTAVGSVHGISPETASTFSSGGFSNYWGAPDYQADAVAAFLTAQGTTNKGLFNASGRGYPDVSAQGENVQIVSGGTTEGVDGTSCSSPIFASVIGLLNDQLIAAGNSPLGFLNPWLYANPDMLNDVTTGSNPGCSAKGFTARAGWDPVTGLGTPNFTKMKAAAGL
ncbi:family S53 protease [Mycena leptocephala]|nr:family S53 protease [Mycena leptocephala]